jgi:hypothetical protein
LGIVNHCPQGCMDKFMSKARRLKLKHKIKKYSLMALYPKAKLRGIKSSLPINIRVSKIFVS